MKHPRKCCAKNVARSPSSCLGSKLAPGHPPMGAAPNTKLEFDSAIGVTFSAPNPATDYKNGDDFIWEWAVGKKFANGLEIGCRLCLSTADSRLRRFLPVLGSNPRCAV